MEMLWEVLLFLAALEDANRSALVSLGGAPTGFKLSDSMMGEGVEED